MAEICNKIFLKLMYNLPNFATGPTSTIYARLFCAKHSLVVRMTKKAISQNIFLQNSYKICAVYQKSCKEFAGDFALLVIHFLTKFDEIDARWQHLLRLYFQKSNP